MTKEVDALRGFARFALTNDYWGPRLARSKRGDYVKARRAAQEIRKLRSERDDHRAMLISISGERDSATRARDEALAAHRHELTQRMAAEAERDAFRAELNRTLGEIESLNAECDCRHTASTLAPDEAAIRADERAKVIAEASHICELGQVYENWILTCCLIADLHTPASRAIAQATP